VWKSEWTKHDKDLKQVVELLKSNKLKVTYGRGGYQIPDSIDLRVPFGQLAFRETDFTFDSTYSILFYLDTNKTLRNKPVIVYTNNKKRIKEYENGSRKTTKIEDDWYFTYN